MNQETRQNLAAEHYPLVRSIVRRMARSLPAHVRGDELEGDGSLGLVEAAQRFQPDRSVEFRTFAARRIKGAVLDALRGRSRRGRGVERRHKELVQLEERLTSELGRRPHSHDFAAAGMSVAEVARRRTENNRTHCVSLFAPERPDCEASTPWDRLCSEEVAPEARVLDSERRAALKAGVARLNERERQVLALYYFEHWTVKRIGALLGVTEARISQIHSGCLKKLRNSPELAAVA